MGAPQKVRFSKYVRPFLIIFDLGVINLLSLYFFNFNEENLYFFNSDFLNNKHFLFLIYCSGLWLFSAFTMRYYSVFRYTSEFKILSLSIKQAIAFYLIVFSFVGIFRSISIRALDVLEYILYCFVCIALMKFLSYYILKKYRRLLHGNKRNIIVIGSNEVTNNLLDLMTSQIELGYNLLKVFKTSEEKNIGTTVNEVTKFLNLNRTDELYCSIDEFTEEEINSLIKEANKNQVKVKFITETEKLFTKRLKTEYYGYIPVLSTQESVLNLDINVFLKRAFDVIFSVIIIVFILSWLTLILLIFIKLESKGPLFYRHKRNGLNYKEFTCYKFRTLKHKSEGKEDYVTKEDPRVTKTGKILRKFSIDELPQFINVFLGDMSVVGPRPHMLAYTAKYSKIIDKYNYIYRHSVKPGLTGLAQIKGYRGEIKSDEDIINRIKYDIFYIENWTLLLDIKIIFQTIINVLKGEEKAY